MSVATPASVLVVEDDEQIRTLLEHALRREGFLVETAADGPQALRALEDHDVDLVVLDIELPGINGLDVLVDVRRRSDVPVILATARGGEHDRIVGLDLGADDYVTKPLSPTELCARVRAVLRRAAPARPERLMFDDLEIDLAAREVTRAGQPVELTALEFDLLAHLAATPRRVFTREQLLRQVWSSSSEWQDPATVTEHVRRLRNKLEDDPRAPRFVRTVRGVGYRFEP